jgi:hypothetical protein
VDKHLDHLTKLHIINALGRRLTRVASLLIEGLRNLFDIFRQANTRSGSHRARGGLAATRGPRGTGMAKGAP